jgi:MFS family permease
VLQLTGSGTMIGLVAAAQFLPVLFLAPYGGLLADRFDKRRILILTQTTFAVLASILGVLTITGVVRLWMVVAVVLVFGLASAADNPARQAFASEMVGANQVRNAVTLNSILVNAARAIGPAIAAVVIAAAGLGVCFLLNAVSYVAVLIALIGMDRVALHPAPVAAREPGQLREGLRYVGATRSLLIPLVMLLLVGTLAYEFRVVLPLLAHRTFDGGPGTYALMTSAMGIGAIIGGLLTASKSTTGTHVLSRAAVGFAVAMALAAIAPTLELEIAALALVGATSIIFLASTPLGGPLIGAVSDWAGPREALGLGALACLLAATIGAVSSHQRPRIAAPAVNHSGAWHQNG